MATPLTQTQLRTLSRTQLVKASEGIRQKNIQEQQVKVAQQEALKKAIAEQQQTQARTEEVNKYYNLGYEMGITGKSSYVGFIENTEAREAFKRGQREGSDEQTRRYSGINVGLSKEELKSIKPVYEKFETPTHQGEGAYSENVGFTYTPDRIISSEVIDAPSNVITRDVLQQSKIDGLRIIKTPSGTKVINNPPTSSYLLKDGKKIYSENFWTQLDSKFFKGYLPFGNTPEQVKQIDESYKSITGQSQKSNFVQNIFSPDYTFFGDKINQTEKTIPFGFDSRKDNSWFNLFGVSDIIAKKVIEKIPSSYVNKTESTLKSYFETSKTGPTALKILQYAKGVTESLPAFAFFGPIMETGATKRASAQATEQVRAKEGKTISEIFEELYAKKGTKEVKTGLQKISDTIQKETDISKKSLAIENLKKLTAELRAKDIIKTSDVVVIDSATGQVNILNNNVLFTQKRLGIIPNEKYINLDAFLSEQVRTQLGNVPTMKGSSTFWAFAQGFRGENTFKPQDVGIVEISKQKVEPNLMFMGRQGLASESMSLNKSAQTNKTQPKLKEDVFTSVKVSSGILSKFKFDTAQANKSATQTKTTFRTPQIEKTKLKLKETRAKILGFLLKSKNPLALSSKLNNKIYKILSKRKGKWFEIGTGLPKGKAELLGVKYTRRTLARSFKLEPVGYGNVADINFKIPRGMYRSPKGRTSLPKDAFVQIKALNRGTGEVGEILSYPRAKNKKVKWF